jgi:hypothetical protein
MPEAIYVDCGPRPELAINESPSGTPFTVPKPIHFTHGYNVTPKFILVQLSVYPHRSRRVDLSYSGILQ